MATRFMLIAVLVLSGLACGSSDGPPCPDFTGQYEVVESASAQTCDAPTPQTIRQPFARIVHVERSSEQELQFCSSADPSSCSTLSGNLRFGTAIDGGSCAGLQMMKTAVDRDHEFCLTQFGRTVVSPDGDGVQVETTRHSSTGKTCPSDPGWVLGDNLPTCERRQMFVLRSR